MASEMAWVALIGGFSMGASLLLAVALGSVYRGLELPWPARTAGYAMLFGLTLTQAWHALFLLNLSPQLVTRGYSLGVFVQSVGFYYLLLGVLRPKQQRWHPLEWAVFPVALVCGTWVPLPMAVPIAMCFGTAATLHLGVLVYKLRSQRRWFSLEMRVLVLFGAMAILIAAVSFASSVVGWTSFAAIYTVLIGASFFLVLYLLLRFPDIASKTEEAVATAYAVTTLSGIDCTRLVSELKRLFEEQRIYEDENLSLNTLAEMIQISSHQLSELINTHFAMGFSRLVRQYRVDAAKKMLIAEPRASVLSVGLSVGFTSQSNFYVAFKEIAGSVPGQFRKQAGLAAQAEPAGTVKK